MSELHLRAPASTSNLGPGFDMLGLALELWLEVGWRRIETAEHRVLTGDDEAGAWPEGGGALTRAFDRALEAFGSPPMPSEFVVRSRIPVGRGLGSSGAAVAAGLWLGARAAGRTEPDLQRLAELGLELEGHPDNSTASLRGGCTLGIPTGAGRLRILNAPLSAELRFTVAWTSASLDTREARDALPARVDFADAVENPRRLALLLAGLERGDAELLALGLEDRLHVAARTALIPGATEALRAAREAGAAGATISGAGSALVALHVGEHRLGEVEAAMRDALAPHGAWVRVRSLRAARRGVREVRPGEGS